MAYIPGFTNDLFISYSHIDNMAVVPDKPWIDEFHTRLEQALWARTGKREVKIWRDPAIDGNVLFDTNIQQALDNSAALISIVSPAYIASDYCRKELTWFAQQSAPKRGGLTIGDRLRIFNVLLYNIHYDEWPQEFVGTGGYAFNDSKSPHEVGFPLSFNHFHSDLFQSAFRKLVNGIFALLSEMKRRDSPPQADEATESIYLADVADSLADLKERVTHELEKEGVQILKSVPPPHEASSHDNEATSLIKKARLSVHLLDSLPGRKMDGRPEKSYAQSQLELARKVAKNQFIWVPKDLETDKIDNELQRRLLSELERGSKQDVPYTFIRSLSTTIAKNIRAELEALQKQVQSRAPQRAALIDTHLKDQSYALELEKYLRENNIESFINPVEEDPRVNMKVFAERLRQVNILIILFGQVAEEWVRRRLGIAAQTVIEEGAELKACGIYLAPPHKDEMRLRIPERFLKVHLLENSNGFNPATINALLNTAYSANAS